MQDPSYAFNPTVHVDVSQCWPLPTRKGFPKRILDSPMEISDEESPPIKQKFKFPSSSVLSFSSSFIPQASASEASSRVMVPDALHYPREPWDSYIDGDPIDGIDLSISSSNDVGGAQASFDRAFTHLLEVAADPKGQVPDQSQKLLADMSTNDTTANATLDLDWDGVHGTEVEPTSQIYLAQPSRDLLLNSPVRPVYVDRIPNRVWTAIGGFVTDNDEWTPWVAAQRVRWQEVSEPFPLQALKRKVIHHAPRSVRQEAARAWEVWFNSVKAMRMGDLVGSDEDIGLSAGRESYPG